MMKRIIVLVGMIVFLLGATCYAYDINNVSLAMDKDSVISTMLQQRYPLINQIYDDKKGNLNLLFRNSKNIKLLVEFSDNQVVSVAKMYAGSAFAFSELSEKLNSKYEVRSYVDKNRLRSIAIVGEGEKVDFVAVVGFDTNKEEITEMLYQQDKAQ